MTNINSIRATLKSEMATFKIKSIEKYGDYIMQYNFWQDDYDVSERYKLIVGFLNKKIPDSHQFKILIENYSFLVIYVDTIFIVFENYNSSDVIKKEFADMTSLINYFYSKNENYFVEANLSSKKDVEYISLLQNLTVKDIIRKYNDLRIDVLKNKGYDYVGWNPICSSYNRWLAYKNYLNKNYFKLKNALPLFVNDRDDNDTILYLNSSFACVDIWWGSQKLTAKNALLNEEFVSYFSNPQEVWEKVIKPDMEEYYKDINDEMSDQNNESKESDIKKDSSIQGKFK